MPYKDINRRREYARKYRLSDKFKAGSEERKASGEERRRLSGAVKRIYSRDFTIEQLQERAEKTKIYKRQWSKNWYDSGVGKEYWSKHWDEKGRERRRDRRFSDLKYYRVKAMFDNSRRRSIKLGIPFSITLDDIEIPAVCPILGVELKLDNKTRNKDTSPSLDRIIPSLGYVPGNVRVISWRANALKSDGTAEEHRLIAAYIDLSCSA